MSLNFWPFLISFVLGLLGIGQLHEYIVSGKTPANFEKAPAVLRAIVESHDRKNARRLVEAASYAQAAGQEAVIPGNLKRTVERLTGRVPKDRFDESPVNVSVLGMTDAELLRATRFLEFKGDLLVERDEPKASVSHIGEAPPRPKNRIAVSRPLGLRLSATAGI